MAGPATYVGPSFANDVLGLVSASYAPLASPTFTGTVTSPYVFATIFSQTGSDTATGYIAHQLDSAAGNQRSFNFATASVNRWQFGAGNGAESGSNAGSDFFINRFSDTGGFLGSPMTIVRSTGAITLGATSFSAGITVTGTLTAAAVTLSGLLTAPSPNLTGTTTAANLALSGTLSQPVATGLTAAGSAPSSALALTKQRNVVTTTASSTGVILPNLGTGAEILVVNRGANALNVYPPSGGTINALSSNAAITLATVTAMRFIQVSSTQYYSC